jgi:hypothetical protein
MDNPILTRRRFAGALLLGALAPAWAADEPPKPKGDPRNPADDQRKLDFLVDAKSFGAGEADIKAVLQSAAGEIWKYCATTKFEMGFRIYRNEKFPITHFEHEDGRVKIGLATEKTFWSQYAFQFAHEFSHALMDHANDWRRLWHNAEHANQWVEETFCEVASLFALRAMGRSWETAAPYPNWRSYGKHLTKYAQDRLEDPKHQVPEGKTFAAWFAEVEPAQRRKWTREINTTIARQFLPLFEAEPAGWDALPALKLCTREAGKTLARFMQEWKANAAPRHHAFIEKVTRTFPTLGG